MHGRLLQVQFLLRGHLYRATSEEANQRWMLGQAECEELAAQHFSDIRSRLVQFSLETIQSDQKENVIGGYLVRETLAAILVTDNLLKPQLQFDSILFLLQDRDYEVRLMFLQKLLDHVQAGKSFESTLPLQTILVQRTFGDEEHLNCYVLTARLLMAINPTTPYPINSALPFSLEHYWDRLVVQLNEKRALSVTESVLPLLGSLLSQILDQNQTLSLDKVWTQQCLDTWSEYIKTYSQKEITLPLREAVVKSLVLTSVHLFDQADQEREQARVTACLAIAQLLQDDDIDVRQDTASIVSRALGLPAPVHHERALELVHLFLTRQFCQSSPLQAHLIQTLSEDYTLSQVLDNELSQTKALFAKENPNIYKEDLIDVQWANADLSKALMKKQLQPIAFDIKAKEWIHFTEQLNTYRNFMRYGPFGLTSGVNVFMAMYRAVLYLHLAVDAPIDHDLTLLVGLRDGLSQLKKKTIHPLIWSLLRGDTGLYSKIKLLLHRYGGPEELDDMFLLAPDSRKV
ncbi:hypothetical protein EDC96DRAFT_208244 [Choanephora cucurbitarum]|nr:hypothetical protein EDC96DRAFT_208244 [Choanephora cucurbitarum]